MHLYQSTDFDTHTHNVKSVEIEIRSPSQEVFVAPLGQYLIPFFLNLKVYQNW